METRPPAIRRALLVQAARDRDADLVQRLLEAGANPDGQGLDGRSARQVAQGDPFLKALFVRVDSRKHLESA